MSLTARLDLPLITDDGLAARLDAQLPQTQCTRCGFADCHAYAIAMAAHEADIDRCPPGGAEGIARLARVMLRQPMPLDASHGVEGPLQLALIDEAWCIGCTLCIKACPVDCIVGAPKLMHTVVEAQCTGCALCVPACPVDCIDLQPVSGASTGWAAWSQDQADEARRRYAHRQQRLEREAHENDERLQLEALPAQAKLPQRADGGDRPSNDARRALIDAALERARARREGP